MKILYGVQGTGNGHIARARVMAKAMSERNDISVDYVFSGRRSEDYFDMECFGEYSSYTGLSFMTKCGKVDKLNTVMKAQPKKLLNDIRHMDLSNYDLVLNDFEPVSAWAAKNQGVMSISISHQAAFDYAIPKRGQNLVDKAIMKLFAPTDLRLGVHWYHFNHPILPPFIIDKPSKHPNKSYILVYLPFESMADIQQLLESISDQAFVCYHPDILSALSNGNISWKALSKSGFSEDLKQCNGVIANGGFELSSEALRLGKKLLLKPLHGQFEQASNVHTLQQLNLCKTLAQLDTDTVEDWLLTPATEPVIFPDDPHPLIDWISKKQWQSHLSLCKYFWQRVKFPEDTRKKLLAL
ncbi:MJ1255/VC2487 family glycosyltransferase [Ningiella sp. W23]|uniref:MJ1255/VC2487 family glycosyltransferase n=1 Tax=Ningiella sp. W23 TaxID=3023715 RepID=UPI003756C1CE